MNILKSASFCLLLLLLTCSLATAQTMAGSPYSVFGIGDRYNRGFGTNRSLGGSGIGLRDGFSLNNLNPASYTAISAPFTQLTQFGLAVTMANQSNGETSRSSTDLSFPGLALWFRLNPKLASSIGLVPYSKVGYSLSTSQTFSGVSGQQQVSYEGSGGLNQLYLGGAYELFKNFSVGAHASYIFGPIQEDQSLAASAYNNDITIHKNLFLNTFNLDFGLQYTLAVQRSVFTLGAVYDYKSRLKGSYSVSVREGTIDASELVQETSEAAENYMLPDTYGAGLSWTYNKKIRLTADASFEDWAAATFEEQGYSLRDSRRLSAGLSFLPDRAAASYVKRIGLDAGLFHENTYLVVDGNGLDRYGYSVGLNLPVSSTLIGLSFEQSNRAPEISGSLISERYSQISINLSLFDIWFVKSKYD
ncbi:hypothetical protein [Cesiribacter sp. SM1]|uniref:hypothetical protein n=1 Tax=Cesiribacter sp. SM1 TaxID=2861196 RepID=UPI001CD1FFEF|nr:hypothetical protein [Cesiribacter sp. SM1]